MQFTRTRTFTVPPVVSHSIIFSCNETVFNFTFQDSSPNQHYLVIDVLDTSGKVMDTHSAVPKSGLIKQTSVLTGSRMTLPTTLKLEWQTLCATNWYSTDCGTMCVQQDTTIPPAHYTCNTTTGDKICNPGYVDKRNNCSINIDECMSSPCQNGSTCVDEINQYSCQCSEFLTGIQCETGTRLPTMTNRNYFSSCQCDHIFFHNNFLST